jgi:hypothetical protein
MGVREPISSNRYYDVKDEQVALDKEVKLEAAANVA